MIELMVTAVVVAALIAVSAGGIQNWLRNQRSKDTARQLADILLVSRGEAIRSGEIHVVFFNTDKNGGAITDGAGRPVVALAIRDGDGDGEIDAGERYTSVPYPPPGSLFWGHASATDRAAGDPAGAAGNPPAAAWTFDQPDGSDATWIAFLPDGTPRAYVDDSAAGTGSLGSGAGAVYLSSGERDYAVVLTPLGGVQVQAWDGSSSQWRR